MNVGCFHTCLPREISLLIFQYLTPRDLYAVSVVCKLFADLGNDSVLWRVYYRRNFATVLHKPIDWKQAYRITVLVPPLCDNVVKGELSLAAFEKEVNTKDRNLSAEYVFKNMFAGALDRLVPIPVDKVTEICLSGYFKSDPEVSTFLFSEKFINHLIARIKEPERSRTVDGFEYLWIVFPQRFDLSDREIFRFSKVKDANDASKSNVTMESVFDPRCDIPKQGIYYTVRALFDRTFCLDDYLELSGVERLELYGRGL